MQQKDVVKFLDELDDEQLCFIQVAALLGASFSLDHIIPLISTRPSKMLELVDQMLALKLIKVKPDVPRGTYVFSSKKLPNLVLDRLDEEKKKQYHSDIVSYLEKELPENGQKPIILADVYLQLKNSSNGIYYQKKAADLLTDGHKIDKALNHYRSVIDYFTEAGENNINVSDQPFFLNCVIAYAPIALNISPPGEIFPILKLATKIADNLGDKKARAVIDMSMGRFYQLQGDKEKAFAHYQSGHQLAEDLSDSNILQASSKLFAFSTFSQGKISEAINKYEETLGDLDLNSADSRSSWLYLILAFCYGVNGQIDRALKLAENIRKIYEMKENPRLQASAHAVIALILAEVHRFSETEPHYEKAIILGSETDNIYALSVGQSCKAFSLYAKGDLAGSNHWMRLAIKTFKDSGQIHFGAAPYYLQLAHAFQKAGLNLLEGFSFDSEIKRLMDWPDIFMKGAALRYHAINRKELGVPIDDVEKILKWSESLLDEAGATIELERTHIELIKIYILKDEMIRAKEIAEQTYTVLSKIDNHIFPSELFFLIDSKSQTDRISDIIYRLNDAFGYLPDINAYFNVLVSVIPQLFRAERCAVLYKNENTGDTNFTIAASVNLPTEMSIDFNRDPLKHILIFAVNQKYPVIISDSDQNNYSTLLSKSHIKINSIVCIPLVSKNEAGALIYFDNPYHKNIFTPHDLDMMCLIAGNANAALSMAFLNRKLVSIEKTIHGNPFLLDQVELSSEFPLIQGKSEGLMNMLAKVRKVAKTDASVLLFGETGVGKELIAKTLHQISDRAEGPFIVVNITALPKSLLESELFGHVKGAFTGANESKPGRFELANNGTLFLDEIGDLSSEAQVKLLRVLQEREFERIGGTKSIRSDFRLIAATNRDLTNEIETGRFRRDLYYRISSFPIEIPPLREREEDIPILTAHFTKIYSAQHKKVIKRMNPNGLKKLLDYQWPGNIRELQHVIEKSVILSENEMLTIPDLAVLNTNVCTNDQDAIELISLEEVDRRHVLKILEYVKWRIRGENGAAKILGLKPSTLEFRIKKLGIKK